MQHKVGMNMKKYLESQSGAALILVLFVVLFLSITGALLLNVTTYSQKSIVNNVDEEQEFYLAEGALDLALHKIKEYEGGPFLYLASPSTNKDLFFSINDTNDTKVSIMNIVNKDSETSAILSASYSESSKSNLTRELNILVESGAKLLRNPIIYFNKTYGSGGASKHETRPEHIGEIQIDEDTYNGIFDAFQTDGLTNIGDKSLNKDEQLIIGKVVEDEDEIIIIDEKMKYNNLNDGKDALIHVKSGSYLEFDRLNMKNGSTLKIEKGAIVVGNIIDINSAKANIIIDGVLVVDKLEGHTQLDITINSSLIAKEYIVNNHLNIDGTGSGINLNDYKDVSESDFPATITVENYDTTRR